jgi:hypothetical protein
MMTSFSYVVKKYAPDTRTIAVPMQLRRIIALNNYFLCIKTPDMNDIMSPRVVVAPHTIEVSLGGKIPKKSGPKIDPKAINDPSTMAKASSSRT